MRRESIGWLGVGLFFALLFLLAALVGPTAEPPVEADPVVYVTETGERYHREGCRYLRKSQIPLSPGEARANGYAPCDVCRP